MKKISFVYDTQKIEFAVMKSKRKSLSIAIQPDGNLLVKAPFFMSDDEIVKWVKTKTGWIVRQRAKILEQQQQNPPKQYVTGEKFLYLGKEYELEKGDLFLIDCEKEHEYSAVSETWDFCYVHINYHPHLQEYYNGICESGENVAFHYPQFYKDCFLKLESFSYEMNAKIEIKASAIVLSTILDLMTISEKDIPQNIKSCANYIAENFTEDISVEFLASIAGLSKYYFIRNFYKYYDSTPYEYLTFCRINHSKNLLISTNASIEQIAGDCGFSSVVTFNRCFKNKEGCSPSNFRKGLKMG